MIKVEIVAIGNELLIGDVLDTNTNWLAKRITGMGGFLERIVLVRDNVDSISNEIQSAISRGATVIFTVGGMGPTSDDMTLGAVAMATNHPLQSNEKAIDFVKQKYEYLATQGYVDSPTMTPAREKMGVLPSRSIPIENPVGAAPAVVLSTGESTVISLPGVPTELKGIFDGPLQPTLKELFGDSFFFEKIAIVASKDESTLAPILKIVSERHPNVYIKSRPKKFGSDVKFRVTLSEVGNSKQEVELQIQAALEDLRQELLIYDISIDSVEE